MQPKQAKALDPTMSTITKTMRDMTQRVNPIPPMKKKKKPMETRPFYSPSRFKDEVSSSLSGLKYLLPSNRPKR